MCPCTGTRHSGRQARIPIAYYHSTDPDVGFVAHTLGIVADQMLPISLLGPWFRGLTMRHFTTFTHTSKVVELFAFMSHFSHRSTIVRRKHLPPHLEQAVSVFFVATVAANFATAAVRTSTVDSSLEGIDWVGDAWASGCLHIY